MYMDDSHLPLPRSRFDFGDPGFYYSNTLVFTLIESSPLYSSHLHDKLKTPQLESISTRSKILAFGIIQRCLHLSRWVLRKMRGGIRPILNCRWIVRKTDRKT